MEKKNQAEELYERLKEITFQRYICINYLSS